MLKIKYFFIWSLQKKIDEELRYYRSSKYSQSARCVNAKQAAVYRLITNTLGPGNSARALK